MSSRRETGSGGAGRARAASPARAAAFEVLRGVHERRGEPASLLHHPRYGSLSGADRDLATEIALGVLRWRASLDWILAHHCRAPLASLEPAVLEALRIGLYQIRHLDRVPAHAAVDESVRLAGSFGAGRGRGLVNAVLRSVLRKPGFPELPRKDEDPIAFLETTLSHPRWLAARYLARLGVEGAEARCRKQNESPPLHVRVSARLDPERAQAMLADEGVASEPIPAVPGCLEVTSGSLRDTSLFREGLAFPQDAGSQLIPFLVDARRDDRVLDVCAAPGAKATALSERTPSGSVVGVEKRRRRARLLADTARRLGARNLYPLVGDGLALPFDRRFARILLDVPCSSLGTLRRNPDVKWRVTEGDLKRLPELQWELLRSASRLLEVSGRLVYATCSTEPEENEAVVKRLLGEDRGIRLLDASESLPESARHMAGADGAFRSLPERDDMDGYFAAVLTRVQSG
jgi:16S rRNA (cytosine967-C5)-methyltransferase